MPTLREFFATEAADFLAQLSKTVQRLDGGSGDPAELQKHSRGLRGSAQMAREDRVYRAALGLESAARTVAAGAISWSEDLSTRIRRTLEDLETLVRGDEADDAADTRVKRALDRWRELGIPVPDQDAPAPSQQLSEASKQFRQFAAHEIAGIIAEMELSFETLTAEPRNRDPLKAILRRERALLGAARLDEISVVAEALRATEDITRIIAKLNAAVKDEWLNVFKAARDVLKGALEPLQRGENPGVSPALSKLRVMRQELTDRYGQGEPVNTSTGAPQPTGTYSAPAPPAPAPAPRPAPPAPAPPAPAAVTAPAPAPATAPVDDAVPIEQLLYSKEAALKRALELYPQFMAIAVTNPATREYVEELFDLIRLGGS